MSPGSTERHALNRSFEWIDHPGPHAFLETKQVTQYDHDGFFLLKNAVSKETRAELLDAIDPLEDELEQLLRQAKDGRSLIARADEITFTTHLVKRSHVCQRFVRSELFRGLCRDLIGPDVRLYWDQAVYKKPGTESPFPWHQDNGYAYVEPQQYLTCWVALTDANEANGCPIVIPGIHRMGTLAHRATELGFVCASAPKEMVAIPAEAGDIVVFSSLTPHSTGPNRTSGDVRKAYIVQFAPDGANIISTHSSETTEATLANDPTRQFSILVAGEAPARAQQSD